MAGLQQEHKLLWEVQKMHMQLPESKTQMVGDSREHCKVAIANQFEVMIQLHGINNIILMQQA